MSDEFLAVAPTSISGALKTPTASDTARRCAYSRKRRVPIAWGGALREHAPARGSLVSAAAVYASRATSLDLRSKGSDDMLHYALVFFIIALIAALFGFGGIAAGAAEIAKILFFIFAVLFLISLIVGLFRRGGGP
jgi:uncharacterized membrane protein YtjA (UPF0391 family)